MVYFRSQFLFIDFCLIVSSSLPDLPIVTSLSMLTFRDSFFLYFVDYRVVHSLPVLKMVWVSDGSVLLFLFYGYLLLSLLLGFSEIGGQPFFFVSFISILFGLTSGFSLDLKMRTSFQHLLCILSCIFICQICVSKCVSKWIFHPQFPIRSSSDQSKPPDLKLLFYFPSPIC